MIKPGDMFANRGQEQNIKEVMPEFYRLNKEKVDSGRIRFFYDAWATEVGCLIDLDTLETLIVDTRA